MTEPTKKSTTTAAAWAKAARHIITLPSGVDVAVEIPDLPELVKSKEIPNDLVEVAITAAKGTTELSREHIEAQPEFYKLLTQLTVKEPEVTDDLYKKLPYEDKEMIVEIATRQRDLDAEGKHIGGLHTSHQWRSFRGLDVGVPYVEGS